MNSLLDWLPYLKRLVAKVKRVSIDALGMAFKECKENPQEQARVWIMCLTDMSKGLLVNKRLSIFLRASGRHCCPGAWKELKAGTVPLFEDARMVWAAEQLGGFSGQQVIELGPLELVTPT